MKLNELFSGSHGIPPDQFPDPIDDIPADASGSPQSVVLGGGCFWCTEAVFVKLDGVLDVASGYAGGTADTADYNSVCSGMTDHAEVIRVRFDPRRITLGQVLKVFFAVAHDPTQLNRQGNDMGRQYRSAVFYADEAQKRVAAGYIRQLEQSQGLSGSHRHDARTSRAVLRGRALSPELRRAKPESALRGSSRPAEGEETREALCREVEGIVGRAILVGNAVPTGVRLPTSIPSRPPRLPPG